MMMGYKVNRRAKSGFVRGYEVLRQRRTFVGVSDAVAWLIGRETRREKAQIKCDMALYWSAPDTAFVSLDVK